LHRADLRDAQAAFVDHLVTTVREEQVDAVLVAGDVYDRAVPSLDAVQLCEEAFTRLRETGAHVVVISGNHDSARRLGFGSRLLDRSGVYLRTQLTSEPVVIGDVPVYALPFLDPGPLAAQLEALDAPSHAVVVAHGWVAGGLGSDSEREITVGGVGAISPRLFERFAYSFSEAGHTKGSWVVEVSPQGLGAVEFVAAPVPRRLSTLRGELAMLLTDPALAPQEGDWLSVTLTDRARPDEAMARLHSRFPHVLVLTHDPEGVERSAETYAARVAGRTDLQVATSFVEHVRGTPAEPDEETLLSEALEAVRLAG
jgi:exonuclease SbcD